MNPKVESVMKSLRRILLLALLALGIGAVFILLIHENPLEAYAALFKGAFVGKLKIGTTLANFTPLLLTSIAFAVAAKAGAFNVGVEGEVFLGGMAAACRLPRYLTKPRQRRSEWDMAGSDGISRVSAVFRGKSLLTNKMRII